MAAKKLTKNSDNESPAIDDINIESTDETGKPDKKKKKKDKKVKKSKGIAGRIVPALVLLLVIGAVVGILGFNLLNIRDRYLNNILQNIPIVNNLLPTGSAADEGNPYSNMTTAELIAEINKLTTENDNLQQNNKDLEDINSQHLSEINRLRVLESQYTQVKNEKAEFDKMIAENDSTAYAKFYEKIWPENASILYQEAVMNVENAKDIKKYVASVTTMEPSAAAKMLEQMITTANMDLVTMIIRNLDKDTAGAVLQAMDAKNAASVYKMLAPTPVPELTNYPPASALDTTSADTTPTSEPTASP